MKFSEELMAALLQARMHRNPQKLNDICAKLPDKFRRQFAAWVSQYAPVRFDGISRIKMCKGKTVADLPPLDGSSIQVTLTPGSIGSRLNKILKTISSPSFISRDDPAGTFAFLIICAELGITDENPVSAKQSRRWFDDLEIESIGHSVRALPGGATGLKK